MSKGTAWFPCYASDLLGSMRWKMMTPAQRGAYWQLICWQMQSADGHLPADIAQLSALADMDVSAHKLLLEAFPEVTEGRRANHKALTLWQARVSFAAQMAASGREGNAKRWGTRSPPDRLPDRLPDVNPIASASLSTSTSTSTSISTTTPTKKTPEGFEAFWTCYPNKKGKQAAVKAWERAKNKPDYQTIIAAVERQKTWPNWTKDGGQYIPNPATWLNQGRWEDQPTVAESNRTPVIPAPPLLTDAERIALIIARGG